MCKFVRVVERLGEAVQAEVNLARLRQSVAGAAAAARRPRPAGATRSIGKLPETLAEDVTDVEDFIAKPHLADRFARVNAKSLRDLTSVRSVAKFARSALNDSDWGSTVRGKVGAALTNLLLNTARVKVPGPARAARAARTCSRFPRFTTTTRSTRARSTAPSRGTRRSTGSWTTST